MTELSFLIHLLLHHKLPKATRESIEQRIQMIEASFITRVVTPSAFVAPPQVSNLLPEIAKQAPSMQALMLKHPDLVPNANAQGAPTISIAASEPRSEPQPVAVIAQNAATAAAMASRAEAIAAARAGKPDASGGKRKF